MRKNCRKILSLVVCMIFLVWMISGVAAYAAPKIPAATNEFYVNDFAGIFSAQEKSKLMTNAVNLANGPDGIQVVVSTVKTLDGYTVEEYANKMYNQYKIGKDDMGVLMLVATEDRQIRMEIGRAMEAYITDSRAGRFLDDYAIPYLRNNQFSEGMISLQEAVVDYIMTNVATTNAVATTSKADVEAKTKANISEKTPVNSVEVTKKSNAKGGNSVMNVVFIAIIAILIFVLIVNVVKRRSLQAEVNSLEEAESEMEAQRKRDKEESEKAIEKVKRAVAAEMTELENNNEALNGKCNSLEKELATLKDRYARAKTIHMELDNEVDEMIREEVRQKDMEAARRVDEILEAALTMPVDKDHVHEFAHAIDAYSGLSEAQKSYVVSDIEMLNQNYNTAAKLAEDYRIACEIEAAKREAENAEYEIHSIIDSIPVGNANNISSLKRAEQIHRNLSSRANSYFSTELVERFSFLLLQAKQDVERIEREEAERRRREAAERRRREEERRQREEAERRRRQEAMRRQSSMARSSSFRAGGFGGRSGGGGASRGF